MTREEVMEFMQRDLDGDLSSEEQESLQLLLANSEEYQEIYAELKMLSVQLESLPKVKPPTSIVDSLLPVFDQIEKEKSVSVQDISNETHHNHELYQMSEVEQSELTVEESSEQKSGKVIQFTRRKFWIPSVIVAAGIMITILATNNPVLNPDNPSLLENDAGNYSIMMEDPDIFQESMPMQQQSMSFDGEYQAREVEADRHIVIEHHGEMAYSSSVWDEEWTLSHMEWISNDQLYYEIVNNDQSKYFVIHVLEKTEVELDSPYQHN